MNKSFIISNKKGIIGTIIILIILLCSIGGIFYIKHNDKQLLNKKETKEKQEPTIKVNTSYLETEDNKKEDSIEESKNNISSKQQLQNSGSNNKTTNNDTTKPNHNTSLNQINTNTNNNTNDTNNTTTNNNTNNTQEIVSAVQEKYCSLSGYTLLGDSCVKTNYSNVSYNVKCSAGYALTTNEQGKQVCRPIGYKEEKAPSPSKTFTCDGGTKEDLFVNSGNYWDCHHGTIRTIWSCSTNYIVADYYQKDPMGHMVQMLYCKYNGPTQDADVIKVCPAEYPIIEEESGKCINKVTDKASIRYVCPSGYVLNGDKCYK